jgi:hypothetical protein
VVGKQQRLFPKVIDSVVVAGRLKKAEQKALAVMAREAKMTQAGYVAELLRSWLKFNGRIPSEPVTPKDFDTWPRRKKRMWEFANKPRKD